MRQGKHTGGAVPGLSFAWRFVWLPVLVALVHTLPCGAQDVLTYHNDNARTGLNPVEWALTLGNVNASQFGKLFQLTVNGKVDAQPLYASAVSLSGQGAHNMLFVATEHDSVYAFDADTGTQLWQASLLGAVILLLILSSVGKARRGRALLLLAASALAVALWTGCGGTGGTGSGTVANPGTPAGTYVLTVTGTSGAGTPALSHSLTLTLTVN